ncbi:MAG: hypothetical protein ACQEQ0_01760, partial [Bacteroidota bacterium]
KHKKSPRTFIFVGRKESLKTSLHETMVSNQKQSSRALLVFSGIWMVLVIIFALSFFGLFESSMWVRAGLIGLIGLVALWFYLGGYYYISLEIENNRDLMVKYYNLFPMGRRFQAFRIPLKQYHHHEIKTEAGGLKRQLILYQKMQGGIAKYPPVGLSAMDRKGMEEVTGFLKKLENNKT